MSGDLEARVVQAAREAVASQNRGFTPSLIASIRSGEHDYMDPVMSAILGARAALAEIERDYILERRP